MHTHQNSSDTVATIGVDIGKNTFHLVGLDKRGAIVLRTKVSRSQLERRLANVPCCLVGLEAGCGAHHIARQIRALGMTFASSQHNTSRRSSRATRTTIATPRRSRRPCKGRP